MRRVRVRIVMVLVAFLIGAVVAGLRLSQPERLLLKQATRVPLTGGEPRQHWWLPGGRMLLTREAPRPRSHPGEVIPQWDIIATIHLFDPTTRKETPLRKLTRLFNNNTDFHWVRTVSPDGKWLLWEITNVANQESFMHVSSLDGSHWFHWLVYNNWGPVLWLPDSTSVVSVYHDPGGDVARICSVHPPHTPREFPFYPGVPTPYDGSADKILLVSEDRLLVREYMEDRDKVISQAHVYETTLQRMPPRLRKFTIHMPRDARVREAVFSPTGDRIAWLLTFHRGKKTVHGLWVCRLDGSGMREIGHVTTKYRNIARVFDLAWLRDGKRLSFCTVKGLYTVPTSGSGE